MRSAIALLPLPLLLVLAPAPRQDPRSPIADAQQIVFHAVLEGLYTDGVENDVLDRVMARDETTGWPEYFIYACPVCMPAWDACATYRARPKFLGSKLEQDTFGAGLGPELRATLLHGTSAARREALRVLVRRWIGRRLTMMRLTDEERAVYERRFEDMREKGLAYLEAYQSDERTAHLYRDFEFCAFCDGACEPDRR